MLVYQRVIFTGFDPSKIQTIVPRSQWPSCTYDPVLQTPSPAMPAEKAYGVASQVFFSHKFCIEDTQERKWPATSLWRDQQSNHFQFVSCHFCWLENLLRFTPKADADPDRQDSSRMESSTEYNKFSWFPSDVVWCSNDNFWQRWQRFFGLSGCWWTTQQLLGFASNIQKIR